MMGAAIAGPTSAEAPPRQEVPLWRFRLLRIAYVIGVIALTPHLANILNPDPNARGMTTSIVAGLWVMGLFGIKYPLQLLPIFIFEFVWKTIWLFAFGLPQWLAGRVDPQLSKDLFDIGFIGPVLFGLVIPWGYVWRHYFRKPAERLQPRP